MTKDKVLLSGITQGSAGASTSMKVGFLPNIPYAPNQFAVQCDFSTTPTSSATLALLGCLDFNVSASSKFVTLGARTVTSGDLTSLSFRFEIAEKAATHIKAQMSDFTGTASHTVKAVATR
jgi:hypothetical protein